LVLRLESLLTSLPFITEYNRIGQIKAVWYHLVVLYIGLGCRVCQGQGYWS